MTATGQNKQRQPLVSIVIPVYNGANYMREAIDSALAQTYPNIEILVINDGSTDETENIALSYGDRIRYFTQRNGGQSAALNRGIQEMRGEYFSWLSHDDRFYPEFLMAVIARAREDGFNPTRFYFTDFEFIDAQGKVLRQIDNSHITTENYLYLLLAANTVNGCTVVIRKDQLLHQGLFNLRRPHTADIEMFLGLGIEYFAHRIPGCFVQSRVHSEQATQRRFAYHMKETELFATDIIRKIDLSSLTESANAAGETRPFYKLGVTWSSNGYLSSGLEALSRDPVLQSAPIRMLGSKLDCILRFFTRTLRRKLVRAMHRYGLRFS